MDADHTEPLTLTVSLALHYSGAYAHPRHSPSLSFATPSATRWASIGRPTCRGLRLSSPRLSRGAMSDRLARSAHRQCTTSTLSPFCASQFRQYQSRSASDRPTDPAHRPVHSVQRGLTDLNGASAFALVLPLLPEIFQMRELRDSPELQKQSATVLSLVASISPPLGSVRPLLGVLLETLQNHKVRSILRWSCWPRRTALTAVSLFCSPSRGTFDCMSCLFSRRLTSVVFPWLTARPRIG